MTDLHVRYTVRLHKTLDDAPWKTPHTRGVARCPFTGEPAMRECVKCGTLVHESAMSIESSLTPPVGQFVQQPDKLSHLLNCTTNITQKRIEADEQMDFKGNLLFAVSSTCCAGCYVWQHCWTTAPRLQHTYALMGLFFALVPYTWAFDSFVDTNFASLFLLSVFVTVWYSVMALVVQIDAIATTINFADANPKHFPPIGDGHPRKRLLATRSWTSLGSLACAIYAANARLVGSHFTNTAERRRK